MFEYLLSHVAETIGMIALVLVGVAIGITLYGIRKKNQSNSN